MDSGLTCTPILVILSLVCRGSVSFGSFMWVLTPVNECRITCVLASLYVQQVHVMSFSARKFCRDKRRGCAVVKSKERLIVTCIGRLMHGQQPWVRSFLSM